MSILTEGLLSSVVRQVFSPVSATPNFIPLDTGFNYENDVTSGTLRLRLRADKVNTMTLDGSNRMTGWACQAKGTLGNAVQTGGDSTKPTYSSNTGTFGGPGVICDGVAQFLEVGAANGAYSFLHKAGGGAVYIVCEYRGASATGNHPLFSTAVGSTGPGVLMYFNGTVLRSIMYDNTGGTLANAQAAANTFAVQRPMLFSARMSSLAGTGVDLQIYRNNVATKLAGADVSAYPSNMHQGKLRLGAYYGAAGYGSVIIREVLIYEGAISDQDHAAISKALTDKWHKSVIVPLLIGDSNALGLSAISGNLPAGYVGPTTSPYTVRITRGTDGTTGVLEAGVNNQATDASSYGMEMSFAKDLMEKYQKEVWLLKKASSGAVLYGASNSFEVATGNQYAAFKTDLNTVDAYLRFRGMIPDYKMLIALGTNNLQNLSDAENQGDALKAIIDDVRTTTGQTVPVAITKLGTNEAVSQDPRPSGLPYIFEGRLAHEEVFADRVKTFQINTDDVTYYDSSHWNPAANVLLGQRAAAVL